MDDLSVGADVMDEILPERRSRGQKLGRSDDPSRQTGTCERNVDSSLIRQETDAFRSHTRYDDDISLLALKTIDGTDGELFEDVAFVGSVKHVIQDSLLLLIKADDPDAERANEPSVLVRELFEKTFHEFGLLEVLL